MRVVAWAGRHILNVAEAGSLMVLTLASTVPVTVLSVALCYAVYFATGYDFRDNWFAMWMPLIAPAAIAPPIHAVLFTLIKKLAVARRDREAAIREARRANRNKTVFFRDMVHDLRSPLTAIIGLAEVMRDERLGPMGNDKYREYAGDILVSGRHLQDLLDNALDLARIEAGRLDLQETLLDPAIVVRDAARIVGVQAEAKGIRLSAAVDGDTWVPAGLLADERCVMQILVNLLTNSIKFTDAGGEVAVRVAGTGDGGVRFEVRDTGVGMSDSDLDRVFEPFHQIAGPQGNRAAGSGLGLAIVRSLAEHHGGRVDIASRPGRGTTVGVSFPAARVVAASRPAGAA